MIVFIIAFVASFIPFIALYLWLRNRRGRRKTIKSSVTGPCFVVKAGKRPEYTEPLV